MGIGAKRRHVAAESVTLGRVLSGEAAPDGGDAGAGVAQAARRTTSAIARTKRVWAGSAPPARRDLANAGAQSGARTDAERGFLGGTICSMRVLVRLFASYREAAGRGRYEMELPERATVRDVVSRVTDEHPLLRNTREIVAARNHQYVALDEPLAEGDEVALIPPVSGGAVTPGRAVDVRVTPDRLSVDAALAGVRHDDAGGVCVFVGVVRNENRGKRVTLLEYEAYPEMAEAKMLEIAREADRRFGPLRIAMHHRVGRLAVGEDAVVIAVAAGHRDAAFAACRFAIDRLKEAVPIWKREHTDDGAVWLEPHA